ncbi:MAG: FAD-dependent oxidoreductase [Myxococcales bacterium]|nr:FAD-dependent oxidoreductase [Myxococcales bacterium]MDH3484395.1 FAD-dependent oxidoreductase [Myxococcales bacterium]
MSKSRAIAIVGASLAGLRTAEFLRRGGFEGKLALIGDEEHLPYDRPPLSKELLRGEWEPERLALRRKSYDELALDLKLGRRAIAVDTDAHEVHLEGGESVAFDDLVVATGGQVRRLPKQPELSGLFTLRTLDDAVMIRDALKKASRIAVIGAGFIGAEVAASARQLGLEVVMIEALDAPLAQSLGSRLGRILQQVHERRGVEVRCGRRVAAFVGTDCVEGLTLDDGTDIPCDLVVVGIGVEPAVSWLKGSGIELDDGVRCDETCMSSVPRVFAAGDVASWYNPLFEERMRVEHWTNAVEQARHVAAALLATPGEAKPFASVPMFWSDQFDLKIQGVGRPRPTDELIILGGVAEGDNLVALYGRAGRLVGAVTFNQPPRIIKLRRLIGEHGELEDAMEIAES